MEQSNTKAATGITKSLEEAMKTFENDILSNQLLITEVQKDLSKLVPKGELKQYSDAKTFSSAQRLQLLKTLKKDEDKLKSSLGKLNEQEKLLESESFGKVNHPTRKVENNLRIDQMNKIKEERKRISERITEIEFVISDIITAENNKNAKADHRDKMKKFFVNFDEDQKKTEKKMKKISEITKERMERLKTSMNATLERKQKEIEEKEKEEKEKRNLMISKIRDHEKELITKRYKENNEKMSQLKNLDDNTKISTPLHQEKEKKYKEKEEKYIQQELLKRKDYMKSIRSNEIAEFSSKMEEKFQAAKKVTDEKSHKLAEEWKERKNKLPTYSYTVPSKEEDESKEETIKIKREANLQAMKDYCENSIPTPVFDAKKKQELAKLNEKKNEKVVFHYDRSKRILLKKRNKDGSASAGKKRKYNWDLKIDYVDKDLEERKKSLLQKKKPIYCSSTHVGKVVPLEKNIDYLQEMKMKTLKRQEASAEKDKKNINDNKWEKKLKNKNNTVLENVEQVRNEVSMIDTKVEQAEEFLKVNGGIQNNPEVGQNVSNMIIDSIRAKLSIITLSKENEKAKKQEIKEKAGDYLNKNKKGNTTKTQDTNTNINQNKEVNPKDTGKAKVAYNVNDKKKETPQNLKENDSPKKANNSPKKTNNNQFQMDDDLMFQGMNNDDDDESDFEV